LITEEKLQKLECRIKKLKILAVCDDKLYYMVTK